LHRDVKPGNIVEASPGVFKLADFGLARGMDLSASMTRTGQVVGTPAYMAPELLTEGNPSAATDLYALAVALHEMLTGRIPPIDARMKGEVDPRLRDELPAPVADLLERVLDRRPAQRPADAAA